MAGKTNTSATFFAQKKLLGKAHTSNLKIDNQESIGSNIQAATSLIFGETIPTSPSLNLNTVQSNTVEYIQFKLTALTGTTYDADVSGGGAGSDAGESSQSSGPHAYKFVLPSNYETETDNSNAGNGTFNNDRIVHETLGALQLVPPFFSQDAPNPYIVKIYKDNGSGGVGAQIPLEDNIDWSVDFYNGILFLQDYDASKIPAFAKCFAYVGKMASTVIAAGGGGGGGTPGGSNTQLQFNDGGSFGGDSALTFNKSTDTLSTVNLTGSLTRLSDGSAYLLAGNNITLSTGSTGAITITSTAVANPAGSNTQIQFNDNGSFGASSAFTFTGTEVKLNAASPKYTIKRALQSQTSTISFNGQADVQAASISHEAMTNDLVFKTFGNGGSSVEEILRLSGYYLSDKRRIIMLSGSGMHAGAMQPSETTDINFFVSGSIGSRGTSTKGTAVFGGDMFVSGTIHGIQTNHVLVSDDTSLSNARVLTAGEGITISTANPREIAISADRTKKFFDITGSHPADNAYDCHGLNFSNVEYNENRIDVFLNGQSLRTGSAFDYVLQPTGSILFKMSLEINDIVQVTIF